MNNDDVKKYQEIEGDTHEVFIKKISIYMDREDYDTALNLLIESYETYKDSADINAFIGEIKYKKQLFDEAEDYFLKAYDGDPENPQVVDRLAVLCIKKSDYEKALEYSKELLELEPYNLAVKQRVILLYFELDDSREFDKLLNEFSDEELHSLFNLIYEKGFADDLDRETLINYLKEARECRILFKNLKY